MHAGSEMVGQVFGKYRIESHLGAGAMGAVYAATHEVTGKQVALKFVHGGEPIARERLLREAQAAARLRHPNLLDVYDIEESGGRLYLIMERLRGRALDAVLADGNKTPGHAVELLMPAMRGVHAGHLAGVVHRDLKPSNIFVSEHASGITVKVLDFGISKLLFEAERSLTQQGKAMGTPAYAAPEQIEAKPLDGRADQYALACVLYELVEGRPPYHGCGGMEELLGAKLAGKPAFEREHPPAFVDALLRALAGDPKRRFSTVADFGRALEGVGRVGFEVSSGEMAGMPKVVTTPGRPGRPLIVAGALLAAAAIAGAVALSSGESRDPVVTPLTPNSVEAVVPPRVEPEPPPPRLERPVEEVEVGELEVPEVEAEVVQDAPRVRATRRRTRRRRGNDVKLRSGSLGLGDL